MSSKVYMYIELEEDDLYVLEMKKSYKSDWKKFGVTKGYVYTSNYPERKFIELPNWIDGFDLISEEEAHRLIITFQLES